MSDDPRPPLELALRESEERFRAFMDNLPAVAFIKDGEGRYLYGNAAWARQFGAAAADLLGRTDFDLWPAEAAHQFRASDTAALVGDRPLKRVESAATPDGGWACWTVIKFPVAGRGGARLLGGIVIDISERRKLEQQVLQAQKQESLGRLASGVAHDFNNLLTVITGYCTLLSPDAPPGHPWHDALGEMRRAAERAADLTRQLLAFSRRQILPPRPVDLNAAVAGAERLLRRLIGEHIEMVARLQATRQVLADPGQLDLVVVNLAVNARDAMPDGGWLTVGTADVTLDDAAARRLTAGRPGDFVVLSVGDTGCGMDEATKARVYEPFFTTKEAGKGTGLGLASVLGVVQQSDGFIDVTTAPGRGSTFRVFLPAAPGPSPTEAPPPADAVPGGRETVLLVEDEESVRGFCRQLLSYIGYTVLEAANGEAALRVSSGHAGPIDLLLTDVVMPGMSGRALFDRLGRQRPGLCAVFMSGYLEHDLPRLGVLGVGETFLHKPFAPPTLARTVRELLDRRQG